MGTLITGDQVNSSTNLDVNDIEGNDIVANGQAYSKSRTINSSGGAVSVDWSEGNVVNLTMTLNTPTTAYLSNAESGASYVMSITQLTSGNTLV